jgi:hypothetical protein
VKIVRCFELALRMLQHCSPSVLEMNERSVHSYGLNLFRCTVDNSAQVNDRDKVVRLNHYCRFYFCF